MKSGMFVMLVVVLAACAGTSASPTPTTSSNIAEVPVTTSAPIGTPVEPVAENALSVFAPDELGDHPVIVVVHGGAWVSGDPETMASLAAELGTEAVVFNATYRTLSRGGRFPAIVEDVACAVTSSIQQASDFTTTPDDVYLVAHSAGAHLAALVAFAPDVFTCDGSVAELDGFVGLAGPYDVARLPILNTMFGATIEEDPQTWDLGNPLTHAENAVDLPILLVHGTDDEVVPTSFSEDLADELVAAGADVRLVMLDGVDHAGTREPSIVGDIIRDFVAGAD